MTQPVLYSFDGKCIYVDARVLFEIHSMSAVSAIASSECLVNWSSAHSSNYVPSIRQLSETSRTVIYILVVG